MSDRIDFYNLAARRKLSLTDDWVWCILQAVGDTRDSMVTMGVPRILKRGPRKGQQTFRGVSLKKCVITQAERTAEERLFEQNTGKCSSCYGTGQRWVGWNHLTGDKRAPCRRCEATGNALATQAA